MNNPDQEILIRAVEDARPILAEYIEAGTGGRDANGGTAASHTRSKRVILALDRNKAAQGDKAGGMIQEIAAPGFRPQVVK
jgi:hypothetical protein